MYNTKSMEMLTIVPSLRSLDAKTPPVDHDRQQHKHDSGNDNGNKINSISIVLPLGYGLLPMILTELCNPLYVMSYVRIKLQGRLF